MCGRFVVFDDSDIGEIAEIIRDIQEKYSVREFKTGEVFPTNKAIVLLAGNKSYDGSVMKWGFPKWDGKGVIINAKSETAAEKKTFMKPLQEARCVIPASGFYEWDRKKNKYLFTHVDENKNPVLYLAGIYSFFKDNDTAYKAFTIFTRDANNCIRDIHNRMPVILYQNEIEDFVNDATFAAYAFGRDNIKLKRSLV